MLNNSLSYKILTIIFKYIFIKHILYFAFYICTLYLYKVQTLFYIVFVQSILCIYKVYL